MPRYSPKKLDQWPDSCGAYVVWTAGETRPLYVGVAETQKLRDRWRKQHLKPRAGSSALRRSLGLNLKLVAEKLKLPARYYPDDVETAITAFLEGCEVNLYPTATSDEAAELEYELIAKLNPILNVKRRRRNRRDPG